MKLTKHTPLATQALLPPRPTLLAICTLPPWPVRNGYSLRVFNILRELSSSWAIILLAPTGPAGSKLPTDIAEHVPVTLDGSGLTYPWRFDWRNLQTVAVHVARERHPHRALIWPGAEATWFERPDLPPAVMDMIDCNPLEFWRGTLASSSLRERYRNLSQLAVATLSARRTVESFAATACVGEQDAAWLSRIGGRDTVHVVPNGVALPPEASLAAEAERPTLVFVGTLDYGPNVDAVCHAVTEIWPRVRQAVPRARFVIAGRNPVPAVTALHGQDDVEVEPNVPDMVPVLSRSWVTVAPMRTGAGIKNKVLEAWACGRAAVMTPLATNGLTLPPGHKTLVRSSPSAMADMVVTLFRDSDLRLRLGLAAREHVRRHSTWAAAASKIDHLLRSAGESAQP